MSSGQSDLEILHPYLQHVEEKLMEHDKKIAGIETSLTLIRNQLTICVAGIDEELRRLREGVYSNGR